MPPTPLSFSRKQRDALVRAIGALRERAAALDEAGQVVEGQRENNTHRRARVRRANDLSAVVEIQRMIAPERYL